MKRTWWSDRPSPTGLALMAGLISWVVSSPAAGQSIDADALPGLSASIEMRAGSLEDPGLGFSDIGSVTIGPDRRIYVVERQSREVRVLSEDGTLLHVIGGPGDGPGEFTNRPGKLGFRGDTLWVSDPWRRRVHLFSRDGGRIGDFASTRSVVDVAPGIQVRVAINLRSDGRMVLIPRGGILVLTPGAELPDSIAVPVLALDRRGAPPDTAEQVFLYGCCQSPPGGIPQGDLILDPWPFTSGTMKRWTGDGRIAVSQHVGDGASADYFLVERSTFEGDLVYRQTFSFEPQRFDPDAAAGQFYAPEGFDFPAFGPGVIDALAGDDGSAWLRRDLGASDEQTWIVLDPNGTPVGRVALPAEYEIRWVRGREALVVERDEFEVPWLLHVAVR